MRNLINALYNLDRAWGGASLFGAPPQETISSEIARHESNPVVEEAADVLDAIQPQHVEKALADAERLERDQA